MATSWQKGDRIENRWAIHDIKHGSMGIVYIVYDHERHGTFAIKTFQNVVFARNPTIADHFRQEAFIWINLDVHPNVTKALAVGQDAEGRVFIVLEYVSGGDLGCWIGTSRLVNNLPQVLRFALQFCDGMIHTSTKGLKAHRDIKPQNCLITKDHMLKVTDFGLARLVALQDGEGGRGGTPEYMPPEQWDNFHQADERADIYSFRVMLYEMLTGKPPFGKRPEISIRELERRHKEVSPPPLGTQLSTLNSVVETCLAKDPASRFRDFGVVRERLAEFYERLTGKRAPQPAVGVELDAIEWNNKGASLTHLGWREEALACYDRALALNRHHAEAWFNKGAVLFNAFRRYREALACFEEAERLEFPRAAGAIALCRQALGM